MYDMVNIFEVFLPQLLRYPNPTDPLNGEAAALMMREQKAYDAKVKGEIAPCLQASDRVGVDADGLTQEYVAKYASKEANDNMDDKSDDSDEMSSVGSIDSDDDDEPAGTMEQVN